MRWRNYTLAYNSQRNGYWPELTHAGLEFRSVSILLPGPDRNSFYGTETYNLYVPTTEELLEWYSP